MSSKIKNLKADSVKKFVPWSEQEIKKQLDDMPLEEFEDFLKGVTAKGHEGRPQHAELLSVSVLLKYSILI